VIRGLRLSNGRAAAIGWTLLLGPVATAAYALTWEGNRVLWIIAAVLTSAALFLLTLGYSWVIVGSRVRVEPNESLRIAIMEERASHDDVRIIDVLVTQCLSVRWFVQKMADRGKDVRLLVHDPDLAADSAQRAKCIQSMYDVITSLSPQALSRLTVYAYKFTPSVRALVLRDARETPLYASVGWYSHLETGVGGSRYPAILFGAQGESERALMKFVDDEVKAKRATGRVLSAEDIIHLFKSSKPSNGGTLQGRR